jgi:hypothetical protein
MKSGNLCCDLRIEIEHADNCRCICGPRQVNPIPVVGFAGQFYRDVNVAVPAYFSASGTNFSTLPLMQ